jgi:hypothetical protein
LAQSRLNAWEALFEQAMRIVDSVAASGLRFEDWSFGGYDALRAAHHAEQAAGDAGELPFALLPDTRRFA